MAIHTVKNLDNIVAKIFSKTQVYSGLEYYEGMAGNGLQRRTNDHSP